MIQAASTTEAVATMAKHLLDRSVPVREMIQKLAGQLTGLSFCFGTYDVVVIAELLDDTAAIATS